MNVDLMFPSKYLAGPDLVRDGELVITIKQLFQDDLWTRDGKKTRKWIVECPESDKLIVLNRPTALQIAKLYGPESKGWIGKQIQLYPARNVRAYGKVHDAVIRARDFVPDGSQPRGRRGQPQGQQRPAPSAAAPAPAEGAPAPAGEAQGQAGGEEGRESPFAQAAGLVEAGLAEGWLTREQADQWRVFLTEKSEAGDYATAERSIHRLEEIRDRRPA